MLSQTTQAVILAAGKSTRFNTGNTKLLEKICGQEMILFITKLLTQMNIETTVVVGYQKELVTEVIQSYHKKVVHFVEQKEQLGTGHAVSCTKDHWNKDHILILNGDMPLVTKEIIEELYKTHITSDAAISFVTSHCSNPNHSYGRVIQTNDAIKIVEKKEFTGNPYEHTCINAGIYLVKKTFLQSCIDKIQASPVAKEFYITDMVEMASNQKEGVQTVPVPFDNIRGINTFEELWAAEQIKRSELIKFWMQKGVRFHVAQNLHIDIDVEIGPGTLIGCGVHLLSGTKIGKNCNIRKFSSIDNAIIEDHVDIQPHCIIRDSHISKHSSIGPFAHIHSQTKIGKQTIIGNFVEVKESTIGNKTAAKHLNYIGNATIGSEVNIGAGTITCNHNGIRREKTIIKNNAFIGSNNTLVAPVIIEENTFTAAGSTITNNVPKNSLAIGRARQINKDAYVQKLLEKLQQKSIKKTTQEAV